MLPTHEPLRVQKQKKPDGEKRPKANQDQETEGKDRWPVCSIRELTFVINKLP